MLVLAATDLCTEFVLGASEASRSFLDCGDIGGCRISVWLWLLIYLREFSSLSLMLY